MDTYGGICQGCGREFIDCTCDAIHSSFEKATDQTPADKIESFLEWMSEVNENALYPTDLKDAVIGMVERFGMRPLILLDRDKCISIFMERDGMSHEEAEEFFDFNTIGAWVGEGTPCFATLLK